MNIPLKGSLVYFFAKRCLVALRKNVESFLTGLSFFDP